MEIPTEKDFGGCLDGQHAWKQFGGLSIDQAYSKFCEMPDFYQEDFMFMGPKAFSFYFPVIEKYLKTVEPECDLDDCSFWIIGCAMVSQYKTNPEGTKGKINRLATVVLEKFKHSKMNNDDKKRCVKKWKEVKKVTQS